MNKPLLSKHQPLRFAPSFTQSFMLLCTLWLFGHAAIGAEEAIPVPVPDPRPTLEAAQAKTLLKNLEFPSGIRVPYLETQMNPMLKAPVSQSGFVEITTQGEFLMQVTSPRPELRRLANGKLSLKRPSKAALKRNPDNALAKAKERTLRLNPEHGGHLVLLAITQVLSGDSDALSQHFDLQSTSGDPWRIVLTPKNVKVKKRLQRLELLGEENQLQSLYTQRTADAWQKLTFGPLDP